MVSKIFCAIGAVLAQLAHGAVIAPIANYAVNEVEWNLPIDPNVPTSPREVVTGTVQQVIAKMEISHPGWTQNFTAGMNLTDPDTDPASFTLATQDERESTHCDFDSGKGKAFCQDIRDGARYLGRIDSPAPRNQPRSCGRVSCVYNSAIWWCNDNAFEKEVTWGAISDSVWYLQDKCHRWDPKCKVSAQDFFKGSWNVYVTGDNC